MSKENYVLLIWDEGGIPHVQGLYPNNEQTFAYVSSVLLKNVQEWDGVTVSIPDQIQSIETLTDWYYEQTEGADYFWRIEGITPQEAPGV